MKHAVDTDVDKMTSDLIEVINYASKAKPRFWYRGKFRRAIIFDGRIRSHTTQTATTTCLDMKNLQDIPYIIENPPAH